LRGKIINLISDFIINCLIRYLIMRLFQNYHITSFIYFRFLEYKLKKELQKVLIIPS